MVPILDWPLYRPKQYNGLCQLDSVNCLKWQFFFSWHRKGLHIVWTDLKHSSSPIFDSKSLDTDKHKLFITKMEVGPRMSKVCEQLPWLGRRSPLTQGSRNKYRQGSTMASRCLVRTPERGQDFELCEMLWQLPPFYQLTRPVERLKKEDFWYKWNSIKLGKV